MAHQWLPQLSKSRFVAGLQCLKRLYLECYYRELADPVDAGQQAIFDAGTAVGELARRRFPDGALVSEEYFEHDRAVESTNVLLIDSSVPALYEAAFTSEGIRTRVDILVRRAEQTFDLIEVKSTTAARDHHIPDVAIQLHVVESCGVSVSRAYLMHVNNAYVYQGGEHDLGQLFSLSDVTGQARQYGAEVISPSLAEMWQALQLNAAPEIDTGPHCATPYRCPFFGHCHRDEPEHPIRELPRLRQSEYQRLTSAGILEIDSIPHDFPGLLQVQRRVRDSVVAGLPFIHPELGDRLREISFPAGFLDFETMSLAVPIYPGTRPYQTVPFQWSLHVREESGALAHSAFLDEGPGDPRERFILALLDALPAEGSIVVYSSYETTILKGLAQEFPQYADRLLALCERVVDLLRVIRDNYYHPGFHGSFSIKSVLPALVPDLSYADLDVPDGMAATAAYARLIAGDAPERERASLRQALLAYCERDTEAMVRVYEALLREARQE